jgi:tripartite-type tricarboxylate transporter receptor subunit TctC
MKTARLALAVLTLAMTGALAQDYPSKSITFVVPFAAGSATDQLARALGQGVTEQTKQSVIVENKPGASGFLAAQQSAKAPADGYTVLISTSTTHAANEHLFKSLPYARWKASALCLGKNSKSLCPMRSASVRRPHILTLFWLAVM